MRSAIAKKSKPKPTPAAHPVRLGKTYKAYCITCRTTREISNAVIQPTKSGKRKHAIGKCGTCGQKLSVYCT